MSTSELEQLEQERARLSEIVNQPTERELAVRELAEVEERIAEQREKHAQEAAAKQRLAIKREYGGLLTEYPDDAKRVAAARKELTKAVQRMNERYRRLLTLEREGLAYGLLPPELEHVELPALVLKDEPQPAALLDIPDYARVMREIVGNVPNVAKDDALAADLVEFRRARLADARPRDTAKEAREMKRFGSAIQTPGYK